MRGVLNYTGSMRMPAGKLLWVINAKFEGFALLSMERATANQSTRLGPLVAKARLKGNVHILGPSS